MEEQKNYEVTTATTALPETLPKETLNVQTVPMTVADQMVTMIPTAGTVNLTQEQKDILYGAVREEDVEIRPDGLVYLPWMEYVTRLRDAFGMNWAIIPQALPKSQGNYIMWPFYLVIEGKLAGFAIGEQEYQPTNYTMTWGDACEGAKSNALMRLCKGIGISLELWRPSFIKAWKEKYAESYPDPYKKDKNGKPKIMWRKKGMKKDTSEGKSLNPVHPEASNEQQPQSQASPEPQKKDRTPAQKKLEVLISEAGIDREMVKSYLSGLGWLPSDIPGGKLSMNNLSEKHLKIILDKWESFTKKFSEWVDEENQAKE